MTDCPSPDLYKNGQKDGAWVEQRLLGLFAQLMAQQLLLFVPYVHENLSTMFQVFKFSDLN